MRFQMLFSSFVLCGAIAACAQQTPEDESMYLTGTEESAVTLPNGEVTCTNPKKTLICHIPPGNPDNAHSICVGNPAVAPHQAQHGDTIGACVTEPPDDDGGDCDGTCGGGDGSGDGGGDGDGSGSGSGEPPPV
jgi:hypothetical protein